MTHFSAPVTSLSQARSQTHEQGGFSDFQCVCLYVRTFIYVYNATLYIYCGYVYYVCFRVKLIYVQHHKPQHSPYTMRSVTLHKTSCVYTHF
jgi:hypothetical protein